MSKRQRPLDVNFDRERAQRVTPGFSTPLELARAFNYSYAYARYLFVLAGRPVLCPQEPVHASRRQYNFKGPLPQLPSVEKQELRRNLYLSAVARTHSPFEGI